MKVTFVTGGSLNAFWQNKLDKTVKTDLLVFGAGGLGLVSYKKELDGETEFFHDVAGLSREIGGVVISGLDTDTYGVYRHSAVIADRGKILGISDMSFTVDDSEFKSGGNFRVYETGAGKIGLLVGEDVYFPEAAKTLALCDADIIISVFGKQDNGVAEIMARASAFSNGVLIALMSGDGVTVAGTRGDVLLSSRKDTLSADIKIVKDYHRISTLRRGFSLDTGY